MIRKLRALIGAPFWLIGILFVVIGLWIGGDLDDEDDGIG